jgi:DNA-binding winged helix-turn-helix (wHTH) protein
MRVRFGDCVLDSDTRELRVRGKAVHISPKGLELTSLLGEIRSAIGDSKGRSRWIRTVHRFGYAFSGLAEPGVRSS